MSVNIVNNDGSLSKIAGGLSNTSLDNLKSDITVNVEITSTASRAYNIGDRFLTVDSILVEAISNINIGDTITLNTNVTPVNIMDLLDTKSNVESSTTNGNIKIDNVETEVYRNYGNNTVLSTDKIPYIRRQCIKPEGYKGYIREKLIGGTIVFNQLVKNGNFADGFTGWSPYGTTVSTSNNIASFTATQKDANISQAKNILAHLYFASVEVKLASNPSGQIVYADVRFGTGATRFGTCAATTNWQKLSGIVTGTAYQNGYIRVIDGSKSDWVQIQVKNFQLIDLTQMFGSVVANYLYNLEITTTGSGVAKLKEWGFFEKPYYDYNTGELVSTKATSKFITGFNLWDEVWEQGSIDISTGQNTTGTGIRSKNYITIIPGINYYMKMPISFIYQYDKNKNFIKTIGTAGNEIVTSLNDSNLAYIKIATRDNVATYNNDICINISDTSKNGTYEPYSFIKYSLGNDELKGIVKLDSNNNLYYDGDIKES